MAAFFIYILKWAVTLTLLYSLYGLWLRRETFHTLNRLVLLFILLVSMLLPAFDMNTQQSTPLNRGMEHLETWVQEEEEKVAVIPQPAPQAFPETSAPIVPPAQRHFSWIHLLLLTYLAVTTVYWFFYLLSLVRFGLLVHRAQRLDVTGVPRGVQVLMSSEVPNSCSWIRWIVLSANDTEAERKAILVHELAHIQHGHSWDKLLCECTCRMLWFLPFAWMLRQDLADVHEFEADRAVLDTGINIQTYNELIIRKAAHAGLQPVVNAFNESKIKKRMTMMFKKKSTKMAALKVLYLLPLIAFAAAAFAKPQKVKGMGNEKTTTTYVPLIPLSEVETIVEESIGEGIPIVPIVEAVASEETVEVADALSEVPQTPVPVSATIDVVAVLDSTMQAVGARKIGEGIYVGAFRPNFTSDTIRVQSVYLDNEKAEHMAEHIFTDHQQETYTITLQVEDRKELGRGYHIRWMHPVSGATTQVHVNNAPAH